MDSIYDLPVTEPANASDSDPLNQMLDNLEMSIVQPGPFPDENPLSMALSRVEDSIVRKDTTPHPAPMELEDMLIELERQIEHQTIPAPEPVPDLPSNNVLPEQKIRQMSNGISFPGAAPIETTRKESAPIRQYHVPAYRMTGHYTGIRNNSEIIWFCNKHSVRIMLVPFLKLKFNICHSRESGNPLIYKDL
jgi:hypothetical protein